jgi:hypothetical protein
MAAFSHALIGWMMCGSIMGISTQVTIMQNTLIIHAVGVTVIFAVISAIYFRNSITPRPSNCNYFFLL